MKKLILMLSIFLIAVFMILTFVFFDYYKKSEKINASDKYDKKGDNSEGLVNNKSSNESDRDKSNQELIENNKACIELGCQNNTKYVGSKNSDKYYLCECSWAKNIKPENLMCFESDKQALSLNYTKSECF